MSLSPRENSMPMPAACGAGGRWMALLAATLLPTFVGCPDKKPPDTRKTGGAIEDRRMQAATFEVASARLNNLPEETNLLLRPPVVIVDASTSRDRRTVEAVLGKHPQQPTGPNNFLFATSGNGRFQTLVKPGDVVRYFVNRDEFGKISAVDLTVFQVLSDDALLTAEGFSEPITTRSRVEIWRYSDEKMRDIDQRLRRYVRTGEPGIDWQPSPDEAALRSLTELLNQSSRRESADDPWQPDGLIATLPEDLRNIVPEQRLAQARFNPGDGRFMQQAIWARDVADWVTAGANDDVHAATLLFDWTVRNIHLDTRSGDPDSRRSRAGLAYRPWQAMLHGRGTDAERAWVFANLCRQKGLDVVMLSFGSPNLPEELRAWFPALLLDRKLYLFEPKLGLPIPGPNGEGVATLEEAATHDDVLRQLDISPTEQYPLKSSELVNVVASIPASPGELSRRMQLVEANLAGNEKVRLSAHPSAVAKALEGVARVERIELWQFPWQTLAKQQSMDEDTRQRAAADFSVYAWKPRLWKGRVLHFQGTFEGADDAIDSYRKLRRLSDEEILATNKSPSDKALIMYSKMLASYWLGILTFERGNYEQSADYLKRRTLDAAPDNMVPNLLWTEGAQYNLARAYEALGRTDEAIAVYESDRSPQQYGNRLRAKWLKNKTMDNESPDSEVTKEIVESESSPDTEVKEPASAPDDAPVENKSDSPNADATI